MDMHVNRTLKYNGPPNAFGKDLTAVVLRARDQWGAYSGQLTVSFSLKSSQDAAAMNVKSKFTIYRGQKLKVLLASALRGLLR